MFLITYIEYIDALKRGTRLICWLHPPHCISLTASRDVRSPLVQAQLPQENLP